MRILSKGSELPFVHESVGWDESTNFKDYDIVFVNLRTLEESAQDYDHPYNESEESPEILPPMDVSTFIDQDGYMIVYLPDSPIAEMGQVTTKIKNDVSWLPTVSRPAIKIEEVEPYREFDLTKWLPFDVNLSIGESGDSVVVNFGYWRWYFGERFSWNKFINIDSDSGYSTKDIARNSYGKCISKRIEDKYGEGYIDLIPSDEHHTYSEFVKNTLQNVFDIESNVEGRAPPAWLSEYSLPNEDNIEDRIQEKRKEIEELEEELDSLTKFKKLLYETSTNLEEVTRESLRELGFTVDSEVPGKRDGILHTDETQFALEITGTTGGIKKSKGRQLDDWVENVLAENPGENVSGLLIVNPEMGTAPNERDISIEPNVERYMRQRGDYKVLSTVDLYHLVELNLKEGVDKGDIEEMFYQDDTLLSLPEEYRENGN